MLFSIQNKIILEYKTTSHIILAGGFIMPYFSKEVTV